MIVTYTYISGDIQVWSADTGERLMTVPGDPRRPPAIEAGHIIVTDGAVTRMWPISPLPGARAARPRDLCVGERRQYEILRPVDEQATTLVESLFEHHIIVEDVLAALDADAALPADVRSVAAALAREREYPSHEHLNYSAWRVVALPSRSVQSYRDALQKSRAACRLVPDYGVYLNTLGAALYRTGAYADALETLRRSDRLNSARGGAEPADVAFLAMTLHALGRTAEADTERARLHTLMGERIASEESLGFLREVEERFGK